MSKIRQVIEYYTGESRGDKVCCPIHGESTPSLHIYDDNESWHCYGSCGEGGDAIEFIRKVEQCSFKESITKMAEILDTEEEEVKQMLEEKKEGKVEAPIIGYPAMDKDELREFIKTKTYNSNNYRSIPDEISKFYGHLNDVDENGKVTARYYPETNDDGKVCGYKCRNHPKDFSFGKVGNTGSKSQLSGQVKFKNGGKYCVPMETMALTRQGWKTYGQLKVGDEVLGYNAERETKEWTYIQELHYFEEDEVFEFGQGNLPLRATGNHRWFVKQRVDFGKSGRKLQNQVRTTSEFTSETRLITNAPTSDEGLGYNSFADSKYEVDWTKKVLAMSQQERVSFLEGALIADGHHNGGNWLLSQNDGPLFEGLLTAAYMVHDKVIRVTGSRPNEKGNVCKHIILSNAEHRTRLTESMKSVGRQPVWCMTTPLGSWVMRQDDAISITGNCLLVGGEEDKAAAYAMLKANQKDGEYDTIAVVSPTSGESSAAKQCARQYEWLDKYEIIVIGMDNDAAGIKAANEIAKVLPKEKVRIATWSLKDPNLMLQEGKSKQFVRDFYAAKPLVTNGVKDSTGAMAAMKKELLAEKIPLPPHMHRLQAAMGGGIRQGRIVNIIGDTSVGKSSHVNAMNYHWIFNAPEPVCVVSLEATEGQYALDLASLHLEKNLTWYEDGQDIIDYLEQPQVMELIDNLMYKEDGTPRYYIIDERDGSIEMLERQMEQMYRQNGCKIFVIDVLTDILRGSNETKQEDHMKWQKQFIKNGVTIINVLHTRKPSQNAEGKLRKVTEYDALGSGTFVQSAAINIVINRDKMAGGIEQNTTYVDMPKCRGGKTGEICKWYYDFKTRKIWDLDDYLEVHPEVNKPEVDF